MSNEKFPVPSNKEISSMINRRYRNKNVTMDPSKTKTFFSRTLLYRNLFIDPERYFYYENSWIAEHLTEWKIVTIEIFQIVCGTSRDTRNSKAREIKIRIRPQIFIVTLTNLWIRNCFFLQCFVITKLLKSQFCTIDHEKWPFVQN